MGRHAPGCPSVRHRYGVCSCGAAKQLKGPAGGARGGQTESPRSTGPCIPICGLATSTHIDTLDGNERCDLCGHVAERCESDEVVALRKKCDELIEALREVVTNGEGFDGSVTDWRISGDVYAMAEEAVRKAEGR